MSNLVPPKNKTLFSKWQPFRNCYLRLSQYLLGRNIVLSINLFNCRSSMSLGIVNPVVTIVNTLMIFLVPDFNTHDIIHLILIIGWMKCYILWMNGRVVFDWTIWNWGFFRIQKMCWFLEFFAFRTNNGSIFLNSLYPAFCYCLTSYRT